MDNSGCIYSPEVLNTLIQERAVHDTKMDILFDKLIDFELGHQIHFGDEWPRPYTMFERREGSMVDFMVQLWQPRREPPLRIELFEAAQQLGQHTMSLLTVFPGLKIEFDDPMSRISYLLFLLEEVAEALATRAGLERDELDPNPWMSKTIMIWVRLVKSMALSSAEMASLPPSLPPSAPTTPHRHDTHSDAGSSTPSKKSPWSSLGRKSLRGSFKRLLMEKSAAEP